MVRSLVYRYDLVANLVRRDIFTHYRRSVLGLLWAQLNPLLSVVIFSFVFQTLVPLNIPHYPAYVFSGLLAWNWFSVCLNTANYSLISSRDLVRKPQFPTEMIVVVSVTTNLIYFALALPILLGLLLLNGLVPNWTLIFLPAVIAVQFCFTLGLALIVSCANVYFRDVLHITAIVINLWFYITPVFYSVSNHNEYAAIRDWNPMAHIVGMYRRILLDGQPPDGIEAMGMTMIALGVLWAGLAVFRQGKYGFVDVL